MSIKYKFLILSIFLTLSLFVKGQSNYSSPFSSKGIGDVYESGLSYNRAFSGMGIGLRHSAYLNLANPAALSAMDSMSFHFEFGASGNYKMLTSASQSKVSHNGNIDYIAVGFPITSWLKTSFGFTPYSSSAYFLQEKIPVTDENGDDLFSITRTLQGAGGINRLYGANSIQLLPSLSLGIQYDYLFGNLISNINEAPSETGTSVAMYNRYSHSSINDFRLSFGLQYTQFLKDDKSMTFGLIYGYNTNLSTDKTQINILNTPGMAADTFSLKSEMLTGLPAFYGFGFSVHLQKVMLGVDYKWTNWSTVSLQNGEGKYNDNHKIIIGGEYIAQERTAIKYYQRIRYRLSSYYERSFLSFNGVPLKNVGITFGLGLPVKRSKTTLNFAVSLGQRSTWTSESLKENFLIFSMDLSLNDIWFVKRKYD